MKVNKRFPPVLLICLALLFISWGCQPYNCEEPVGTHAGQVQGIAETESGTCSWRGIPYAAPPVGQGRFRAPQEAEPWEGVLHAETFGAPCWQPPTLLNPGQNDYFGSEDCLTLNIWRPVKKGVFPVMVFIHGGSFLVGSGSDPVNLGGLLAGGRDLVVVTLNYRLGPFGFLSHERLAEEDPNSSTGNYGILDQIKALEWVKGNISRFGGDHTNITIYGSSAGAVSACVLLGSPLGEGLFEKVILQSGGCDYCLTREDGFALGEELAEVAGCTDGESLLDCLREKDPLTIIKALPFDPTRFPSSRYKCHVDGHVLTDQPLHILEQGGNRPMPVLAGCSRDEYTIFIWSELDLFSLPLNWNQYELEVRNRYPGFADKILGLYPPGSYPGPVAALAVIEGDRWFRCKMRASVSALSRYSPNTYFYHFTFDDYWLGHLVGAAHGMQIPFLFKSFDHALWPLLFPLGPGQNARYLSELSMDYWANFARKGDPNREGLPAWPPYEPVEREHIVLDVPVSLDRDLLKDPCDFWDEYPSGPGIFKDASCGP